MGVRIPLGPPHQTTPSTSCYGVRGFLLGVEVAPMCNSRCNQCATKHRGLGVWGVEAACDTLPRPLWATTAGRESRGLRTAHSGPPGPSMKEGVPGRSPTPPKGEALFRFYQQGPTVSGSMPNASALASPRSSRTLSAVALARSFTLDQLAQASATPGRPIRPPSSSLSRWIASLM